MTPARVLTFAEDLPAAALSSLAANGAPAWLIDVAAGCIPAANAAGSAMLGLDRVISAPLLDAAMPALVRLRAIARETGGDQRAPERLLFWKPDGVVRLRCRVHIVRAWPEALALVTALEAGEETLPAEAVAAPGAERIDDIARRIREGRMTRLSPAPKAPHQDIVAPVPAHPQASGPAHDVSFPARARLAHELKTPVSAIAAAAEIMEDERFGPLGNPRYAGYVRDIRGSAQHALGVIDRMLADSRAEPQVLPHDFAVTEIDTGEMLAAMVSQLAPLAERAGITLVLDLAPRLPHVIADATSLRQIVLNLITNALKFTDRGGRITVAARSGGDGLLSITVSDTGSGMSVAEIERRLAPVARAPREARGGAAKGEGLGLGLPLVQALAAANGAELSILSAPGKGTSASVVFEKGRVVPV